MATTAKLTARTLPRNPQRHEAGKWYQDYALEHFSVTADGCKSLLRTARWRLPAVAPTARSLLAKLVRERQGVYAAFLGRLMCGATVSSAAEACGIRRESTRDWLARGLADQRAGADTYYSRFASDVHAAIGFCVVECEVQVASRSPLEYLRTGPGRAFYAREQFWQSLPADTLLTDSDVNPLAEIDANEPARLSIFPRTAEAIAMLNRLFTPAVELHSC